MQIDWKSKLSSRKWWSSIVAVLLPVMVIFGISEPTQEQITALVAAIGALVAYTISETVVDTARIKAENENPDSKEP